MRKLGGGQRGFVVEGKNVEERKEEMCTVGCVVDTLYCVTNSSRQDTADTGASLGTGSRKVSDGR